MCKLFKNTKETEYEDPFKDKVKCEECKCWIDKTDSQHFTYLGFLGHPINEYYCQAHKKPYDEVSKMMYPHTYFKKIRVDEKGEPIGYKKIK